MTLIASGLEAIKVISTPEDQPKPPRNWKTENVKNI